MKNELSAEDISLYRKEGFLLIEDFLSPDELKNWRTALDEAVLNRNGNKLPDRKEVYGKGDDADKSYYDNVFDQLINLWKDNEKIKNLMLDERIGKMAAQLAGGAITNVNVGRFGKLAQVDSKELSLFVLRGMLKTTTNTPVTLVHAPVIAEQRGIVLSELKSDVATNYASL